MKTLQELHKDLDANIPRSAVKEREGAGKRKFCYLSTDYVIDRNNKVFGNLNWSSDTVENRCVFAESVTDGYGKSKLCVSYIARVKIEVQHIDENGRVLRTSHVGTGYGDGSDGTNLGKAHELAAKEAESDALKRACKNLGQSMGLALYDKEQTNVDDEPKQASVAQPEQPPQAAQQGRQSNPPQTRPSAVGAHSNREQLNKNIGTLSKIVNSKGRKTYDEMKAMMREKYGTDEKEKLTDDQAGELKVELEKLAG